MVKLSMRDNHYDDHIIMHNVKSLATCIALCIPLRHDVLYINFLQGSDFLHAPTGTIDILANGLVSSNHRTVLVRPCGLAKF